MMSNDEIRPYPADEERAAGASFLFPLRLPIVRSDYNPLISRLAKSVARSVRLPDSAVETGTVVGRFGGPAPQGGHASVDDLVSTLPANLRVTFVLQQMENEIVSGDGVTAPCWARWELHGSIATVENNNSEPFTQPAPGPGEVWPVTYHQTMYDAIVQDGCGNTQVFPVELHSSVGEQETIQDEYVQIGEFSAEDHTTLQPNGFWTFAYTIRAVGTNGGVSDFKFRGVVSVTCTTLETF